MCSILNARIEKNGTKHYIAGSSLSTADIVITIMGAEWANEKNPNHAKLQEVIASNHALKHFLDHHLGHTFKEYLATRPETPM